MVGTGRRRVSVSLFSFPPMLRRIPNTRTLNIASLARQSAGVVVASRAVRPLLHSATCLQRRYMSSPGGGFPGGFKFPGMGGGMEKGEALKQFVSASNSERRAGGLNFSHRVKT